MKPITADNNDGRVLLALRAGEMTPGELAERGLHFPGWLITAGYVARDANYYRITVAGRVACPYRNPLAATVAAPARMEINMSRITSSNKVSRVDVLAVIAGSGPKGIKKSTLVADFDHLVPEAAITSHLVQLKKDGAIDNPRLGWWVAVDSGAALAEVVKPVAEAQAQPDGALAHFPFDPKAVLHEQQQAAPRAEDLMPAMPELAVREETIEIKGLAERRAPTCLVIDSEESFKLGIFSNGEMSIELDDGIQDATIILEACAVKKLRAFLGLFREMA